MFLIARQEDCGQMRVWTMREWVRNGCEGESCFLLSSDAKERVTNCTARLDWEVSDFFDLFDRRSKNWSGEKDGDRDADEERIASRVSEVV